jgi:hypothetical protein
LTPYELERALNAGLSATVAEDFAGLWFRANLDALRDNHPDLARALDKVEAEQPGPTEPIAAPITDAGVIAFAGFGDGSAIRDAVIQCRNHSVVVVYEPRVGRLRWALSSADCALWLGRVLIVTEPDAPALARVLHKHPAHVALGLAFVPHDPSLDGLPFFHAIADASCAVRTMLHTNLVLAETTLRNQVGNLAKYASSPGVADLKGVLKGRPAIVVSAGPSLDDALPVLADPRTRERCCIIATQTVLKALLAAGVRPHFVCALDYAELSARYYTGLTAEMVEGITLVVESKVHPSVPAAWPGALRVTGDGACDALLGLESDPNDRMRMGATVAHLCHFLARHMGCDPVILTGQDLCYTGGRYYADCVARQVWAAELAAGKDLAALHAERLAFVGHNTRTVVCTDGAELVSDVQLLTYLSQFEQAFEEDRKAGLTVIDAGEGLAKRGATREPLGVALVRCGEAEALVLPPHAAPRTGEVDVPARLAAVAEQAASFADLCRDMAALLLDAQHGDRAAGALARIKELAEQASQMAPTSMLAEFLNSLGRMVRNRADRDGAMGSWKSAADRQRAALVRDVGHALSLGSAADRLARLLRG